MDQEVAMFQADNPLFFFQSAGLVLLAPILILLLYWKAAERNGFFIQFRHFYFLGVGFMFLLNGVIYGTLVAISPILFWPMHRAWHKPEHQIIWRLGTIASFIFVMLGPVILRFDNWSFTTQLWFSLLFPYLVTLPLSAFSYFESRRRFKGG